MVSYTNFLTFQELEVGGVTRPLDVWTEELVQVDFNIFY
jgi:hypothetical protein